MAFTYTLLADGPSDAALLPILNWLLKNNGGVQEIEAKWADQSRYPRGSRDTLAGKIAATIGFYPCKLLFIHRDAERGPRYRDVEGSYQHRYLEISNAVETAKHRVQAVPTVCVIPIRMTEAWLLFDEIAIRKATSNRRGTARLTLPEVKNLETLPNPKGILRSLLREASGLTGRKLADFPVSQSVRRIPDYIGDFSPLHTLRGFRHLEEDIRRVMAELNGGG